MIFVDGIRVERDLVLPHQRLQPVEQVLFMNGATRWRFPDETFEDLHHVGAHLVPQIDAPQVVDDAHLGHRKLVKTEQGFDRIASSCCRSSKYTTPSTQ